MNLPLENENLPANHQDIDKVTFGDGDFSPPPVIRETAREKGEMNFFEALEKCAHGEKITRISWEDENIYGVMKDAFLTLFRPDAEPAPWTISEGDFLGTDWITL